MKNNAIAVAAAVKRASPALLVDTDKKNAMLAAIADSIEARANEIVEKNLLDLSASAQKPKSFLDRLRFDVPRIHDAAEGLRKLIDLPDPVGRVLDERVLYNGIKLKKVTVPIGVICIVYEARPNVTVDAAGLCLKASDAVVLRGSADALNTNRKIVEIIRDAISSCGIDPDVVGLAECDHNGIAELLSEERYIDLAIPRGSKNLIQAVRRSATVPVIETGAGNCCAYIDGTCDVQKAIPAIVNAKTSRVSVCNALETLLIAENALDIALPVLEALSSAGVTIHADERVRGVFPSAVPATDDDMSTEYLSMDISAAAVSGVSEAVELINKCGTHHSDAIFSSDADAIEYFYKYVDSAVVYSNASTRFTDGGQFGLGAEIGISTQKLHARGPMGLDEIVTYKYIAAGNGQTRK